MSRKTLKRTHATRRTRRTRRVSQRGGGKELVKPFLTKFKKDDKFAVMIAMQVNKIGNNYFKTHTSGYINPLEGMEDDDILDMIREEGIPVYTKKKMAATYEEEIGDEYNEEGLHTAFSDAFRHSVVVDLTDSDNPQFLPVTDPRFTGMHEDYVFTWPGVKKLAEKYPKMFVITVDTEDGFQMHIPVANADKPKSSARSSH